MTNRGAVFMACVAVTGLLLVVADDARSPSSVSEQKPCPKGCYKEYSGDEYTCNCCHRDGGLITPCAAVLCGPNTTCEAVISQCKEPLGIGCNFEPEAKCRAICSQGNDVLQCKRGQHLVNDIKGCKACYSDEGFVNPCDKNAANCTTDETCVLQEVTCIKAPCYPLAECHKTKKNCPPLPAQFRKGCPRNCIKVIGSDGCDFCNCCNGCVNYQCPRGQECTLEPMFCIRWPCPVMVKCREL